MWLCAMRRIIFLTFPLLMAPLSTDGQQTTQVLRIGFISPNLRLQGRGTSLPCEKACGSSDTQRGKT